MAPDGSGETRCRVCERIGHAHPQCTAVVTLVDAPNPPLHVYFDAGLLPPSYRYTDYSWVHTSTALASLPPQNWVIELQQRQQQQQFGQRQRWIDQKQQQQQQKFDQRQRWIDQERQRKQQQQQQQQQQLLE